MYKINNKKNYFYNHSDKLNITISGENIIDLLNLFSIKKIDNLSKQFFYTILMNKKIFLAETLIIFLTPKKCILNFDNDKDLYKTLKYLYYAKRKFPFVEIKTAIKNLTLISLHGANILSTTINHHSFKTEIIQRQGYKHVIIYSSLNNLNNIINILRQNNYQEINIENYYLFLYNNKVIPNFDQLTKKIKYKVIQNLYNADNYGFKFSKKIISVKLFIASKNIIVNNNMKVYNNDLKKIGYIYRSFHNPNNKRTLLLCIVYKYKILKYGVIKDIKSKNKLLIRERITYK